ncbi:MAG: hypothetical protein Q4P66_07175 [Actinomycetaceae bacterium]|nr:hypothetical protein [Actinomycetaceae bacterium]
MPKYTKQMEKAILKKLRKTSKKSEQKENQDDSRSGTQDTHKPVQLHQAQPKKTIKQTPTIHTGKQVRSLPILLTEEAPTAHGDTSQLEHTSARKTQRKHIADHFPPHYNQAT